METCDISAMLLSVVYRLRSLFTACFAVLFPLQRWSKKGLGDGLFPLLANRLLISSTRRPSLRGLGELVPPDLA